MVEIRWSLYHFKLLKYVFYFSHKEVNETFYESKALYESETFYERNFLWKWNIS